MNTLRAHKKPARKDWHKADIKAALEKEGWTLRRLSVANGQCPTYLANALDRPLPRGEEIIAAAIGVPVSTIWPSRYEDDGSPKRGLYRGSYDNGRDWLARSVRQGEVAEKDGKPAETAPVGNQDSLAAGQPKAARTQRKVIK